jgi:hypothetical protein
LARNTTLKLKRTKKDTTRNPQRKFPNFCF